MGRDEFEVGTTFSQNRKAEDGLGLSTPHRSKRVNLGTPANYYFKYMNSTKKSATKELTIRQDDENEDTGTISIPGFRIGGGNLQTETSFFSMAGSSTSSEGSGDILNKSTLSDTTELTASNFVLVTTSKQTMIQQTRDHCTPAKDKENAENRKCDSNSSKSVAMNRKDNAAVDDKKTIVDGNMAETAKEPETSSLTNQTEEMHGVLQQRSVHYTSPSIRSRFSASPTSLRKFHENLKNSRIKRQQQREEDMKRRLSVEGNNTLDSINAQLQALTNHGALTKKRLPPPFTQLSQQSLSQESIVASTDQFSPSESSTDGTVTINMADLDDLLGIKTSGRRENQSSITAHQSAVQHALNDENSATSQGRDQTSTLEFLAKYRVNGIVNSSTPSKLSPETGDSKKINESNIQSNPSSSGSELKCLSPHNSTVASLKLRSASSNPRKRMTPSKLSSTPQRVVNPMSIFSPASNTRSAKKRRKLLEEQEKSNPASVENALVERKEPSPKIGICLFHEASTTGHDSSIDSESSAAATGADHDRGAFESHPAHDGDTASLGDIADVFGMENTTDGISFGEVSVQSNQHARKEKDPLSDGQETASMANIDDSIKEGFPLSYESSSRESIQKPQTIADRGGRFSQGLPTKERDLRGDGQETASISDFDDLVKQGFIPSNKFSLRETLDEPDMGTGEISKISQGLSDKESDLQGESQEMTSTSRSNAFKEQKSPPRNGTSGRERCEQPHISNDNIRRKSKDSTSNSTSESHDNKDSGKDKILVANDVDHSFSLIASKSSLVEKEEHEPSGSETNTFTSGKDPMLEKYDSPTPRSGSDMLCTPPDIQTASFESTAIPSRSFDRNSHLMNLFPKSPIQMTPSNHKKPTPSKLAPSPRRVMNPMNPNSPARNTRSSLKKILPTDGSGLKSILGGEPRQNCALTREQQDNDGNHGVLRCSKRRQSLCVRPVAEQMEESHSSEQTPFLKPCNGILSSKKKNMLVPKPSTGILSSKKKLFSRRSVAFGSPEAAEYNIGSPSVSLTPMPKGRAKALFTLPATYSSSCSNQVDTCDAGIDESECAGNKSGVDLLVDKITVKLMNNSPELSPIEKKKIDTDAFQVPSHLMPSEDSRLLEDKTVESVTEINGQFSNNSEELKRRKSLSKRPSENKENSAELTDSENIASIYSKCHQCTADLSVPIDAQRLDFNDASESSRNNISTKVANEGDSVEIERNMLSSLQDSTEDATLNEDRDRDRNDKSELPSYLASTGTTEIKVMCQRQYRPRQNLNKFQTSKGISENHTEEGDMLSLLQASENHKSTGDSNGDERMDTVENSAIVNEDISEQYTGNLQITSSPRADEDGKTVELEGNMLSLLQASENHKSTGDSNGDERMDTAENSTIVNEDISEQYTGNLQITSSPRADEDGKTVELEGNMLSLLQASENHKSTGGSNGDERMDTAENSAIVNADISEQYTGNLQITSSPRADEDGKTVELEGNMLSLLQASENHKSTGGSNGDERMDTAENSAIVNADISEQYTGNLQITSSPRADEDGKTVELEGNMLSLLQASENHKSTGDSNGDERMDTAENSAIVNEDISEQYTGNLQITSSPRADEDGKTVELEGNMLSLLQASENHKSTGDSNGDERMDTVENSAIVNADISEQYTGNLQITSSPRADEDGKTVELEGNMLSLLQASENHKSTGGSNGDERMDTAENSAIVNEDISEQYTGNLQITSSPRADEDGKTVELEGNMLSLLQASENHKSTGGSNGDERMDTAENSAIVNADISEQYTGNLQITSSPRADEDGKTVELEGNMLSLLQASENHESTGGSNGDERMDTAENSSTEGEVISLLQAHESRKCQKRGNVTFDRMEVSSESTRFSASSLLGNVSTGGDTIEVDNSNLPDLGGNEKPLNEENILTDVKGITADSATLVMANESHAQKLNCYQDDESCTRDCPFEVLAESDVAATRRKSLSSNSFTLNRVDHVQNLVNDITIRQTSSNIDKSVSFSDTTEFIKTINVNSGPSDDLLDKPTNVDIASFTSMIFEGLHPVRIQEDGLSDSFTRSGKSNDAVGKIVCDRWRQFIEAVCGEVERRIDQEGTAATSLRSLVEEDPGLYYSIQHRFQSSGEHSVIRESLKRLVEAGQILIGYEWNSWLVTVLESFHGPLTDIPQAFTDDISKIDEALQQSKILETDVSFMNDRRTKRARRKSLARHRTMVTALEREIESIESQLCAIKAELEQMEREKVDLLKATTSCYDFRHNAELHDGLKVEAEISQRSFSSLRGLHSWSVSTLSESDIEISIIGSCKQTYLELMYKGTKCGTANTNVLSKIDSSQKMEKSLYVYHGSIATFLEIATKRLIYMAQKSDIKGEFRINDHLLRYAWLAGRLDIVAKEFQVVQRRYRGKLYRDSKGSFSFIVEFESNKSKMVADFAIESEYPSFPVEVRLDLISGKQDLERIRKALVKNAKPGFGSLSRACDIIHSIMSG